MNQLVNHDPSAEPERSYPATESQRELWAAARLGDDASCAFNESVSLYFEGDLDLDALRHALGRLVQAHEALRGTFSPEDGRFRVATRLDVPLPVEDLSALTEAGRAERSSQVLAEEVDTPFELERGPLLRLRLLQLGKKDHRLTFTAHHLICDGWSMAVLLRDLGHFYSAMRSGTSAVAPAALKFSDYARKLAELETQPSYQDDLRFWHEQFQGDVPSLELPTDRRRPTLKTFRADRYDHALAPELVGAVKRAGAKAGASFFTTMLAAYAAFLNRLTGQGDLVIGIPAAGQSALGMENLVGHCVNFLPIRCQVDPGVPFSVLLKQVRAKMLDAYEHQQVTFGKLLQELRVPRDPSRLPLVSTMFNVDQAIQSKDLPYDGLRVAFSSNPRHFENFELFINASESAGRIVLECQYNRDLFDDETIVGRLESFEAFLNALAADPEQTVARLPLLSVAQQQRILVEWNATSRDVPRDQTIVQLLEEQVRRAPERIALHFGTETLTYANLEERAKRRARQLQAAGVERGTLVGVCVERSVEMVVSVLAVLKAGAGYVPLDPSYPRDRLHFMATDAQLPLIVTQGGLVELFAGQNLKTLCVDGPDAAAATVDALPCPATSSDVAYVIYTSGSTGKPKGVQVPHGAVVNFIASMAERPGIGADDVLLAVTTLSFDISVAELFLPLAVGARIELASRDDVGDGLQLAQLMKESGATIMQATPSTWRLLLQSGWSGAPGLTAWTGGEALPAELAQSLLPKVRQLWNLYGPTETTVWSTGSQVTDGPIRIGKPFANTQVYILDPNFEPVPVGVVGELYLGGAGVTLGYLHRPELTRERFVDNPYHDPFADYLNPRLYRTGDLARWHRDGTLECLGRNDSQVKLRGHRIELAEIESVLARHPSVQQAVAVVREDRPGDPRLVAYTVAKAGQTPTVTELRRFLKEQVPDYMVPQHFVDVESLPLTNNGKVDRKRLPAPFAAPPVEEALLPTTPAEVYLAGIWRDVLQAPAVGAGDSFFNLGGHSLLAFQVLARIEKDTGLRLPPRTLVLSTLAQVALHLPAERFETSLATEQPAEAARGFTGKLRGWFGSK